MRLPGRGVGVARSGVGVGLRGFLGLRAHCQAWSGVARLPGLVRTVWPSMRGDSLRPEVSHKHTCQPLAYPISIPHSAISILHSHTPLAYLSCITDSLF